MNLCVCVSLRALGYLSILKNPAVNLECLRLCSFGLPRTPHGFPREVCAVFFSGELEGACLSWGAVPWPCLQMAVVTFLRAAKGWNGAHPSRLLLSRLHGTT